MSAYRKFTDAWRREARASSPPKPAKAPKVDLTEATIFGRLGKLDALGGTDAKIGNTGPPSSAFHGALTRWGEAEEVRAAIVEHDGRIPREWAEGFARLDPDRPPADVPLSRWQRFIDDVGLFSDRWAAYAAVLGWGPYDLFGCDRDRPFARIDQSGLLGLLNGDKLVALSEDAAGIETRAGERHTYRRKSNKPGSVLAWELE